MDCVAIGDYIAIGVATPLSCEVRAVSDYTSSKITTIAGGKFHTYCVVSAGTNDPNSSKLASNLEHIRNMSSCKVYVWIIPVDPTAAKTVKTLATANSDKSVTITTGPDGIHPANYTALAGSIQAVTGN
jgi:hypothetical protein